VKEVLALSKIRGVHAMHDAAEGGLVAALNEIGEVSKRGFSLDFTKVPVPNEIYILARQFRLSVDELMSMSSTGTLIVSLEPGTVPRVLRRLSELNVPASVVGTFSASKRRIVKDQLGERQFPTRAQDPFSKICA
jgi:hydrogenase maturation factor